MNALYEGLFIFPEELSEEQLDKAIDVVKTEMEKLGGSFESSTRLGKRTFARPLKKKKAGSYAIVNFRFDGKKMAEFKLRLKLATEVFRSQFKRVNEKDVAPQEA